ncbi:hypothetical protein TIFTF001_044580 [Ficus carica]|uniref:Uncharacterized protein n=1 Tax=Ficus carica TaxID=3494 RepID=A0AA87ZR06_FICCA|nr:hypothetical protein TIFTF001_044580 [Ficus carica]
MQVMMASELARVVPTRAKSGWTMVNNLLATDDARWKGKAWRTVKCGDQAATRFEFLCGSLQNWYQSGSLRSNFTVSLPSPPSLYTIMDPAQVVEDRRSSTSFYKSQPLLFDGTRRTVSLSVWLYDTELIFRTSHIVERLQVSLASRCLVTDARLWWMTHGERVLPDRTWAHFRALVTARYGPILEEGAGDPYRDLEIYRDMQHRRYQSFVADWRAYPQESMGHYCQRFQEAMLPHIPQDIPSPGMQALVILRNGLPPQLRQYVAEPMLGMTVGDMIADIVEAEMVAHAMQAEDVGGDHQAPVDDAGLGEPQYEAEADGQDAADDIDAPEDQPEDPPIIDISSDDDDDDMEPAPEPGDWGEDVDDLDDDPEEILFDDDDWDVDSDASSVATIEIIV